MTFYEKLTFTMLIGGVSVAIVCTILTTLDILLPFSQWCFGIGLCAAQLSLLPLLEFVEEVDNERKIGAT